MVIAFSVINYYIVCSWDIWKYGGRAMVQSYPVMMILMAAFIDLCRRKLILKWLFAPLIILFIYYNFWFLNQAHSGRLWPSAKPLVTEGLLDGDFMPPRYFWSIVGRWQVPEETIKLKEATEIFTGTPNNLQVVYENDFEQDTVATCIFPEGSNNHQLFLDKDHWSARDVIIPRVGMSTKWLRVQATFAIPQKEWNVWSMTQFRVELRNGNMVIHQEYYRADRFLHDAETKELYLDIRIPETHWDNIRVQFTHPNGNKQIFIDNLKVLTFNEQ